MRHPIRAALLAVASSSALVLAGCADAGSGAGGAVPVIDLGDGLQIVTTTTQVHDFVEQLTPSLAAAGVEVEITPLLEAGESAHGFEPTAADLTAMSGADLLVESGMGLEAGWLDDAASAAGFGGSRIDASAGFSEELLHAGHAGHGSAEPTAAATEDAYADDPHATEAADDHASETADAAHASETETADAHAAEDDDHGTADSHATESADEHAAHDGHDHGDGPNPHLWAAPAGAELMVENIAAGLEAAAPEHADAIRADADAYLGQLDALTEWITENIRQVPEAERTLVTNHDALEHFTEQFHITQVGSIIPSWDDAAEPSAADLDALIAAMQANGVKAIFTETQLSPATAETIAAATGAKVYSGEDAIYTDALGAPGTDGATYLGAQIHNVERFMESWGRTASAAPAELTA